MKSEELDAETKHVYTTAEQPEQAVAFQAHLMLWVKVLGAERTKECLATAVDIFDAAAKAYEKGKRS
jgi:hypothetical protein